MFIVVVVVFFCFFFFAFCYQTIKEIDISVVFITQSYFSFPIKVRLNSTHYLTIKIHNKIELKNIAIDHSTDISSDMWGLLAHFRPG